MIIKSHTNKNNNLLFRPKSTNDLYVENGILQITECLPNIACMPNIVLTKFRYNIAIFDLNGI